LSQFDQADQALTRHSSGQPCVLQGCVSLKVGHAEPPFIAFTTIVRERA
jgi:hypothetical protein